MSKVFSRNRRVKNVVHELDLEEHDVKTVDVPFPHNNLRSNLFFCQWIDLCLSLYITRGSVDHFVAFNLLTMEFVEFMDVSIDIEYGKSCFVLYIDLLLY